jgi:ABC-type cobalamin/Fe3+-siderophores transport system ATPase subunit
MSDLVLNKVSFHYPGQMRFSISELSLRIPGKKITALIGPNGSGKTTILKILAGMLEPSNGSLFIDEKNYQDFSRAQLSQKLSFLPQKENQNQEMATGEYILTGRAPYVPIWKSPSLKDKEIVYTMLDRFHYQHLENISIQQVSGGEFQKIRLMRVFAQKTKVLLLDEPTSHLDLKNRRSILKMIREEADQGVTIIFSTHDPDEAADIADHLILLRGGKAMQTGSTKNVFTKENFEKLFNMPVDVININGKKVLLK